ncbi:hypothetical protein KEM54_005068 [Ascosphaera aggregata]|nr:hypothetical protein KEM54_005068 [Ascosphaera aggregata]
MSVIGSLQDSPGSAKPSVTVLANREESLRHVGVVLPLVEASKSGFMGLYLLLESFTILDAMEVYVTVSAKKMLKESFKFWFYALCLSIICIVWQLAFYPSGVPRVVKNDVIEVAVDEQRASDISRPQKQRRKEAVEVASSRAKLMKELVAVSCDILVPGGRLEWISVSDFTVGSMSIVSTLFDAEGRWHTVQRSAAAASECS